MNKVALFGRLVSAGLASFVAVATVAKPPEPGFWLTGIPPGSPASWVNGLTQDGQTAAGVSPSFTWTKFGGRFDFGQLPGMPAVNIAHGLSDNGAVVGTMNSLNNTRAYRWTGSGPLQDLGLLPGEQRSFGHGVSGNGDVVVGYAEHGTLGYFTGEAFRWTPTSGMTGLGHLTPSSLLSDARGVSRDGATIVGLNIDENLTFRAFKWTQEAGMQALPNLPNAPLDAEARAVNADGSVVTGSSHSPDGTTHIVRWKNGSIEDLAAGLPNSNSLGFAVSDDGEVIGGTYSTGAQMSTAMVWTQATGSLDMSFYLAMHGVAVPTYIQLNYVYAISGDGLTFGGQAKNTLTDQYEGWVATVPRTGSCAADCDASGDLNIDDFICFQTRFAISDPYADCDASGALDIDDFICFQTFFAVGC